MVRVAEALQVSVGDLTDLPRPSTPEFVAAEAAVPAIRAALNVARLGEAVAPRHSLVELRAAVAGLAPVWKGARYDRLSLILPDLILNLHALASVEDEQTQRDGLRLIVEAMHCDLDRAPHGLW